MAAAAVSVVADAHVRAGTRRRRGGQRPPPTQTTWPLPGADRWRCPLGTMTTAWGVAVAAVYLRGRARGREVTPARFVGGVEASFAFCLLPFSFYFPWFLFQCSRARTVRVFFPAVLRALRAVRRTGACRRRDVAPRGHGPLLLTAPSVSILPTSIPLPSPPCATLSCLPRSRSPPPSLSAFVPRYGPPAGAPALPGAPAGRGPPLIVRGGRHVPVALQRRAVVRSRPGGPAGPFLTRATALTSGRGIRFRCTLPSSSSTVSLFHPRVSAPTLAVDLPTSPRTSLVVPTRGGASACTLGPCSRSPAQGPASIT